MTLDYEPAFPFKKRAIDDREYDAIEEGMSLRDWFAGKAMQAMINKLSENPIFQVQPGEDIDPEKVSEQLKPGEVYHSDPDSIEIVTPSYEEIVERAYEIADAMLEEREDNGTHNS